MTIRCFEHLVILFSWVRIRIYKIWLITEMDSDPHTINADPHPRFKPYNENLNKFFYIQDVIKFIYCGKLDKLGENAAELFRAADMYQIDNLKGKYYTSQITFSQIIPIVFYGNKKVLCVIVSFFQQLGFSITRVSLTHFLTDNVKNSSFSHIPVCG